MSADLWQRGCERLAAELPEQQFNTWIRPLPAAEVTDQGDTGAVVLLRVPNRFKLDWIRNQYAGRIEAVLAELAGKPVRLDITLAVRDSAAHQVASPAYASNGAFTAVSAAASNVGFVAANQALTVSRPVAQTTAPVPSRSRLNLALT